MVLLYSSQKGGGGAIIAQSLARSVVKMTFLLGTPASNINYHSPLPSSLVHIPFFSASKDSAHWKLRRFLFNPLLHILHTFTPSVTGHVGAFGPALSSFRVSGRRVDEVICSSYFFESCCSRLCCGWRSDLFRRWIIRSKAKKEVFFFPFKASKFFRASFYTRPSYCKQLIGRRYISIASYPASQHRHNGSWQEWAALPRLWPIYTATQG